MSQNNCPHLLGALSDYLDQDVSAEVCAEIERHLRDCEDCRVVVDTLRKTVVLYRDLPPPLLPDEARRRLYKTLDLAGFLP